MIAARWSLDLVAVVVLALLGAALALIPGDSWFEGAILLLLVLPLPGYALSAALFQPRTIPAAERLVYVIALSIAVTGLGGVLTQVLFRLDRGVFVALLLVATVTAAWVAQRRRELLPHESASPHFELPRINLGSVVALALAIAVAALAFSSAVESARDSRSEAHFAQLWLLPQTGAANQSDEVTVSIGIGNFQAHPTTYRLLVVHGSKPIASHTVRLSARGRWRMQLQAPRPTVKEPLRAILLLDGRIYREAFLRGEPGS